MILSPEKKEYVSKLKSREDSLQNQSDSIRYLLNRIGGASTTNNYYLKPSNSDYSPISKKTINYLNQTVINQNVNLDSINVTEKENLDDINNVNENLNKNNSIINKIEESQRELELLRLKRRKSIEKRLQEQNQTIDMMEKMHRKAVAMAIEKESLEKANLFYSHKMKKIFIFNIKRNYTLKSKYQLAEIIYDHERIVRFVRNLHKKIATRKRNFFLSEFFRVSRSWRLFKANFYLKIENRLWGMDNRIKVYYFLLQQKCKPLLDELGNTSRKNRLRKLKADIHYEQKLLRNYLTRMKSRYIRIQNNTEVLKSKKKDFMFKFKKIYWKVFKEFCQNRIISNKNNQIGLYHCKKNKLQQLFKELDVFRIIRKRQDECQAFFNHKISKRRLNEWINNTQERLKVRQKIHLSYYRKNELESRKNIYLQREALLKLRQLVCFKSKRKVISHLQKRTSSRFSGNSLHWKDVHENLYKKIKFDMWRSYAHYKTLDRSNYLDVQTLFYKKKGWALFKKRLPEYIDASIFDEIYRPQKLQAADQFLLKKNFHRLKYQIYYLIARQNKSIASQKILWAKFHLLRAFIKFQDKTKFYAKVHSLGCSMYKRCQWRRFYQKIEQRILVKRKNLEKIDDLQLSLSSQTRFSKKNNKFISFEVIAQKRYELSRLKWGLERFKISYGLYLTQKKHYASKVLKESAQKTTLGLNNVYFSKIKLNITKSSEKLAIEFNRHSRLLSALKAFIRYKKAISEIGFVSYKRGSRHFWNKLCKEAITRWIGYTHNKNTHNRKVSSKQSSLFQYKQKQYFRSWIQFSGALNESYNLQNTGLSHYKQKLLRKYLHYFEDILDDQRSENKAIIEYRKERQVPMLQRRFFTRMTKLLSEKLDPGSDLGISFFRNQKKTYFMKEWRYFIETRKDQMDILSKARQHHSYFWVSNFFQRILNFKTHKLEEKYKESYYQRLYENKKSKIVLTGWISTFRSNQMINSAAKKTIQFLKQKYFSRLISSLKRHKYFSLIYRNQSNSKARTFLNQRQLRMHLNHFRRIVSVRKTYKSRKLLAQRIYRQKQKKFIFDELKSFFQAVSSKYRYALNRWSQSQKQLVILKFRGLLGKKLRMSKFSSFHHDFLKRKAFRSNICSFHSNIKKLRLSDMKGTFFYQQKMSKYMIYLWEQLIFTKKQKLVGKSIKAAMESSVNKFVPQLERQKHRVQAIQFYRQNKFRESFQMLLNLVDRKRHTIIRDYECQVHMEAYRTRQTLFQWKASSEANLILQAKQIENLYLTDLHKMKKAFPRLLNNKFYTKLTNKASLHYKDAMLRKGWGWWSKFAYLGCRKFHSKNKKPLKKSKKLAVEDESHVQILKELSMVKDYRRSVQRYWLKMAATYHQNRNSHKGFEVFVQHISWNLFQKRIVKHMLVKRLSSLLGRWKAFSNKNIQQAVAWDQKIFDFEDFKKKTFFSHLRRCQTLNRSVRSVFSQKKRKIFLNWLRIALRRRHLRTSLGIFIENNHKGLLFDSWNLWVRDTEIEARLADLIKQKEFIKKQGLLNFLSRIRKSRKRQSALFLRAKSHKKDRILRAVFKNILREIEVKYNTQDQVKSAYRHYLDYCQRHVLNSLLFFRRNRIAYSFNLTNKFYKLVQALRLNEKVVKFDKQQLAKGDRVTLRRYLYRLRQKVKEFKSKKRTLMGLGVDDQIVIQSKLDKEEKAKLINKLIEDINLKRYMSYFKSNIRRQRVITKQQHKLDEFAEFSSLRLVFRMLMSYSRRKVTRRKLGKQIEKKQKLLSMHRILIRLDLKASYRWARSEENRLLDLHSERAAMKRGLGRIKSTKIVLLTHQSLEGKSLDSMEL